MRKCQLIFLTESYHFTLTITHTNRIKFFHILPSAHYCLIFILFVSHPSREKLYLSFSFALSWWQMTLSILFMSFIGHLDIFEKISTQILGPIFNWLFVSLLLSHFSFFIFLRQDLSMSSDWPWMLYIGSGWPELTVILLFQQA